jgi:hypothetical protein
MHLQFSSANVQNRSTLFTNSITTKFYEEATRLWESEERKDSLTRLQSAMLLYMVLGKNGRDKAGHTYLVDACRMARDLGLSCLSTSTQLLKPFEVSDGRWERARAVTAWALFNFQLYVYTPRSFMQLMCAELCLTCIPFQLSSRLDLRFQYRIVIRRTLKVIAFFPTLANAASNTCHSSTFSLRMSTTRHYGRVRSHIMGCRCG